MISTGFFQCFGRTQYKWCLFGLGKWIYLTIFGHQFLGLHLIAVRFSKAVGPTEERPKRKVMEEDEHLECQFFGWIFSIGDENISPISVGVCIPVGSLLKVGRVYPQYRKLRKTLANIPPICFSGDFVRSLPMVDHVCLTTI